MFHYWSYSLVCVGGLDSGWKLIEWARILPWQLMKGVLLASSASLNGYSTFSLPSTSPAGLSGALTQACILRDINSCSLYLCRQDFPEFAQLLSWSKGLWRVAQWITLCFVKLIHSVPTLTIPPAKAALPLLITGINSLLDLLVLTSLPLVPIHETQSAKVELVVGTSGGLCGNQDLSFQSLKFQE